MKKLLTILLSCALLAGASLTMIGCTKTTVKVVDPDADISSKIGLNIILPYVSDNMKQNPAIKVIDDVTGYKTNYEQFPTGANANTELTKIITDKKTTFHALKLTKNQFNANVTKAAAFADLTEVVNSPKFKVLKDAISPEAWEAVTYNGKIMGIPDSASNNNFDKSVIIRKDLLFKLDKRNSSPKQKWTDIPRTLEEFREMLLDFKAATGTDTALTLAKNMQFVPAIAAAKGVNQMWTEDADGKLVYAAENPKTQGYLDYMLSLRKDGTLDMAMQQNDFSICATNFGKGDSIATVSNFWEMETIYNQLTANNSAATLENCVAFAYGFADPDDGGRIKSWQSSGVSYVTVVPNWMASTGTHVMSYVQSKLQEQNFVKIVAGNLGEHYKFDDASGEFEPTAKFSEKTGADHFVTGTNDTVYKKYWTEVVVKGNQNMYYQWYNTNTRALSSTSYPLVGFVNPVSTAPAFSSYSEKAAGIEDRFTNDITIILYGKEGSMTLATAKANWEQGDNKDAIKQVKDWYAAKNK